MELAVLLALSFIISCLCQSTEVPRTTENAGYLQHSNPDGMGVSSKLHNPHIQSTLNPGISRIDQSTQENVDGSVEPVNPSRSFPSGAQRHQQSQEFVIYEHHSMLSTPLKQLILELHEPRGPYIDPSVFIYRAPFYQTQRGTSVIDQPQPKQETERLIRKSSSGSIGEGYLMGSTARKGAVTGRDNDKYPRESDSDVVSAYKAVPVISQEKAFPHAVYSLLKRTAQYIRNNDPTSPKAAQGENGERESIDMNGIQQINVLRPKLNATSSELRGFQQFMMPEAIQQLLALQAQAPYHVIADRIAYKPKELFIPEFIIRNGNGINTYQNQVDYTRNGSNHAEEKSGVKLDETGN